MNTGMRKLVLVKLPPIQGCNVEGVDTLGIDLKRKKRGLTVGFAQKTVKGHAGVTGGCVPQLHKDTPSSSETARRSLPEPAQSFSHDFRRHLNNHVSRI
ncbi:hypothetical protein SLEP1_g7361 [Rubroshorea leprosula]|uniref:Uncharacterized protein n=1 Tax=Rubroshorea leprosula TaxID=152421 RepID=A0AAV5I7D8_9ROSI|nr:hypothetical protein SLEP1_g7361 [Rubroshorea leprosula]